jgi:hypothetical protein
MVASAKIFKLYFEKDGRDVAPLAQNLRMGGTYPIIPA